VIIRCRLGVRRLGIDDGFGSRTWRVVVRHGDGRLLQTADRAVVGAGNSALEEATFLTRFADKVFYGHRRDSLRASAPCRTARVRNPKIEFSWNQKVAHVYGDEKVDGIGLVGTDDGRRIRLDVAGLFVAIGSDRVPTCARTTSPQAEGTIAVDGRSSRTNLRRVRAGDVIDPTYKQGDHTADREPCVIDASTISPRCAPQQPGPSTGVTAPIHHDESRNMSSTTAVTDATPPERGPPSRDSDPCRLLGGMVRSVPCRFTDLDKIAEENPASCRS